MAASRIQVLLQRKNFAEATATAERFVAWAETLEERTRDDQRYNAACLFSMYAEGIEAKRDEFVDRAIKLLERTKSVGYFIAPRIAHIKQDPDFHAIRQHPKFVAFVNDLESTKQANQPVSKNP